MPFIFLLISVLALLFAQRILGKQISRLVRRFGGGHNAVIWFWSVLFLPGTLVHEVSHFLMAAATGARTGSIEILPEFIEDDLKPGESRSVKLGSVQVGSMNPIQGFLVGLAPFITGSLILTWLSTVLLPQFQAKEYLIFGLAAYLFFTVANSFFPSREDLKHTLPFVVLMILLALGAWYLGIDLNISANARISEIAGSLGTAFFASFGVNAVIIFILFLVNRILRPRKILYT